MFQEYFSESDLLNLPLVGLLIFVALFVGIVAFVLLGLRDRDKIDRIARLPLENDHEDQDPSEGRAAE